MVSTQPVAETTWLLGAGASKDAGVPLATEMRELLQGRFDGDAVRATYDWVCAGVTKWAARQSLRRGWRSPNIEDIANTIDALIGRHDSELGPFVGAWHPWLDDMDPPGEPSRHAAERVASVLQRIAQGGRTGNPMVDWTEEGRQLIAALDAAHRPGRGLIELRNWLVREVRQLVSAPYDDATYLQPLTRTRIGGTDQCAGGTLNYDLCVEQAFEAAGMRTCDGFRHWRDGEAFGGHDDMAHIYKPHGSIRWHARNEDDFYESDVDGERPGIIFGGHNKLTAHGPFLDSLLAWRTALEACRNLIIVGYSFGDDHLNALIGGWLRRSPENKRVVIVDPGFKPGASTLALTLLQHSNEANAPAADDTGRLVRPNVLIIREYAKKGIALAVDALA